MRILTTFLILFYASFVSAQKKGAKTNQHYFKVSAFSLFMKDSDGDDNISPAGYFGVSQSIAKHLLFGIDVGLYKPAGFDKVVLPLGLQLGIGNFTEKKISPVFFVGGYYPFYDEQKTVATVRTQANGVFQWKVDGGLMIPFTAKNKIIVGGGYQQLITRHAVFVSGFSTKRETVNTKFYLATVTVIF